ncbi:MAG: aminoacetone oxidase family FAD-binding enzyme [Ruminococcaceae bacterium]|nr:aminoacetone oxidase family FAD-binding enzyme [Oscillospiraceae bacterium]
MSNLVKKICVVGGGAAGMMAAGTARQYGVDVTIFENTDRLGKKLAITGKGRCNVTNDSQIQEFLENVTKNPRFLYSALNSFSTSDTMAFFESLGVKLKVERGKRVYPESDKAKDIVDAMRSYSSDCNVKYNKVTEIKKLDDGAFSVTAANKKYVFDSVIIATGGKSYPLTGSDGSGYRLASKLGHKVTELIPSLIPIESTSTLCSRMQGLSLKNISVKIKDENNKILYTDFGEMMFAHFGVTGPVILSASAHLRNHDISKLVLSIDLKPALDEKTLDQRLLSDFSDKSNKDFINSLSALLPSKMIEPFIEICGVDARKKVNSITKEERKRILNKLKNFEIPLFRFRTIDEAIITSGGIDVSDISPKDMQSKIVSGLFFAGEIIDVDAYTGGFNLQIAFSTGYLAGKSAAEYILF